MNESEPKREQVEKWTEEFNKMADVEGYITRLDLEVQLQRENKNPTDVDIDYLTSTVQTKDNDGECKICLDDYLRIQQNALKMSFYSSDIQKELIKALEEFDEQGDGTMRKEELKAILVDYDDKNLDKVIAHADLNKDGRLSIKALAAYLTTI